MSDNLGYVFAAFLITWLALGVYLLTLGKQVQALRQEVATLAEEQEVR